MRHPVKITPQILSIPPYISTPWKNISSLHASPVGNTYQLVIILNNRMRSIVPDLDQADIDSIFEAHTRFSAQDMPKESALSIPLMGQGIDVFNSAMTHNAAQSDFPELPKELLSRVAGIAKILGLEDPSQLPKAEPHCNCPYCQIARSLYSQETQVKAIEEEVADIDLTFRNWDIKQTAEQLYNVSNPLDENEHYSVFLGDPLGCTCGEKNCEHIRAVLNS